MKLLSKLVISLLLSVIIYGCCSVKSTPLYSYYYIQGTDTLYFTDDQKFILVDSTEVKKPVIYAKFK